MPPLPPPFATDPITPVYQAILSALTGWAGWMNLVTTPRNSSGNINDLTQPRFAVRSAKDIVQPGDLPEITLLQRKFQLAPYGSNSRVSEWWMEFPLVQTNSNRLQITTINALTWQTFMALVKAGDTLGIPYVRGWEVTDGGEDVPILETMRPSVFARETTMIVAVLNIRVHMYADKLSLFNASLT